MRPNKEAMRTRLGEARAGPNGTGNPVAPAFAPVRLLPISAKIELSLSREIDDYAKAHGITRSRAAGHYLTIARETLRSREGVAAGKAEEILEALEGVRTIVELLGPPAFGLIRLLAHWATQSGGLKVSEDELLAELRTVAADEWEQVLSEAERELHDALRKARPEGGE
ncbi:MAG TPA: hypothetical protein VN375_16605 [Vicinamibacteria bacterium]|nr:hypothetical protein [Vicinamibacteria bacterium]